MAVYGLARAGTDESGAIKPFNEYGRTKYAAEEVFRRWQADTGRSLIIIRPTVIFGPGNRGNVYNLFQQVAAGRFVMIGRGENKKSMVYIANAVRFLDACLSDDSSYAVYNCVDEPSLAMSDLVSQVRQELNIGRGTGIRIPYFIGLILGYIADSIAIVSKKKLMISSVRVRKFASDSYFRSSRYPRDFVASCSLEDAISDTIRCEFIDIDPNQEIFVTE